MPILIYILFLSLSIIFNSIGHSSLLLIYPKPINYILMSPSLHWLHHSDNPKHFSCNLGNTFTFWDKLFGSYLDEENLRDIKGYGVKNTDYNKYHPIYASIFLPIIKFKRSLNF